MVDAAKATPIKGGGGIDTFMNTALAAPITGFMPPEIFGAFLNVSTTAGDLFAGGVRSGGRHPAHGFRRFVQRGRQLSCELPR